SPHYIYHSFFPFYVSSSHPTLPLHDALPIFRVQRLVPNGGHITRTTQILKRWNRPSWGMFHARFIRILKYIRIVKPLIPTTRKRDKAIRWYFTILCFKILNVFYCDSITRVIFYFIF